MLAGDTDIPPARPAVSHLNREGPGGVPSGNDGPTAL
jgi:hypothetical protein